MTETATVLPGAPEQAEPMQPSEQYDYFGFAATEKHFLPDKTSWVEITVMNEGAKSQYQKKTSRDLVLERRSGNARMNVDPSSERHELIKACVVGWNLKRNGVDVPFNGVQLGDFLTLADPKIVEDIEKACRKANPWLLGEMSSEDIQREIDNLEEMKKVAVERERGESA